MSFDFALGAYSSSVRTATVALSLIVLLWSSAVEAQPSNRKIGFAVQVVGEGLFKTTVTRISVSKVSPDSQALAAGVAVGDELVQIETTSVPGANTSKLMEHMAFVPGVPKKITFKRPNGALYDVIFVRASESKSDH